ncbi:hypothetical protein BpHYR1_010310 [Brachionus plicatilis]|uniref:Uncharacterized protein n=1 Tax=Brachionus plicatilis TaxID=10195 RepID=A0A3M7T844_BRAPC|nr:hypothetical protein BpHYR1_010310 [Brachionus plicatilis]
MTFVCYILSKFVSLFLRNFNYDRPFGSFVEFFRVLQYQYIGGTEDLLVNNIFWSIRIKAMIARIVNFQIQEKKLESMKKLAQLYLMKA